MSTARPLNDDEVFNEMKKMVHNVYLSGDGRVDLTLFI